jgi:hypothetical protein
LGRKNKHWSIRQVGRIFHVLFSISEPLHSPSLSLSAELLWWWWNWVYWLRLTTLSQADQHDPWLEEQYIIRLLRFERYHNTYT